MNRSMPQQKELKKKEERKERKRRKKHRDRARQKEKAINPLLFEDHRSAWGGGNGGSYGGPLKKKLPKMNHQHRVYKPLHYHQHSSSYVGNMGAAGAGTTLLHSVLSQSSTHAPKFNSKVSKYKGLGVPASSLPHLYWKGERTQKEGKSKSQVATQMNWRKRVDNLLAKYHY
jgi:hypothetical protein